jgi:RimJ/RimL family protein N-acetyltransferase
MKQVIVDNQRVYHFVNQHFPVRNSEGIKGIGLEQDGELIAGVLYDDWSGTNIWMHVAAIPGRRWLNREYLRVCFGYPFIQLNCLRISGWVEESNWEARRFDEHLGFKPEAVLERAARDGGNVIVYRMFREECRFI